MPTSDQIYDALCEFVPGGVNSPFRAFHLVGGKARVLVRGQGARVWDADGREYLDFCCGWGPLVLGHSHPAIVSAVTEALQDGALFGAPTPWELELAQVLREFLPSLEMMRLVNSGAEAVMSALRVARAATGRSKIIKFEGCYHGHVAPLDAAGQEALEAGGPIPLGTTPAVVADTLLATYGDLDSVRLLFEQHPQSIACVILEPVTGSMGVIEGQRTFLAELQGLCHQNGALVIYDEVLTGFRVAAGGAQVSLGLQPDLTCLGKAVAGGLPVGVYGGRAELMRRVAPLGPVYQAGTFCGNPLTVRAALAAMREYRRPGFFEELSRKTEQFCQGLRSLFPEAYVPSVGGMFGFGFGVDQLRDHSDAQRLDTDKFAHFFHAALAEGVYFPPSTFDAASLSVAHTEEDLELALRRLERVAATLSQRTL
jgi:glutamate-1-semialdehyde 2,1-aminomutase